MAETLKRITPEEVLKALTENNLFPVQDFFTDIAGEKHCTCGLSALVISRGITFDTLGATDYQEDLVVGKLGLEGFEYDYLIGFMTGFDGKSEMSFSTIPSRVQGKQDGQAAWEAVKHLALAETEESH